MRRALWPLLLALASPLPGCGCGGDGDSDGDSDEPTPCAPGVEVTSIDRLLDPKLSGDPSVEIALELFESGDPPEETVYHLAVAVEGPAGVVATLVEEDVVLGERALSWDGRDADGVALDPGEYTIRGTLSCTDDEVGFAEPVHVVRLGVSEIRFLGGNGERLPLLYHRFGGAAGNYYPLPPEAPDLVRGSDDPAQAGIDRPDGTPRPFDGPWGDLESPPIDDTGGPELDHYDLPVAITAGTRPEVEIVLGAEAVSASTGATVPVGWPIADLPIRPRPEGWTPLETDPPGPAPGEAAYATKDAPVADGVAKTVYVLRTGFEYREGGIWHPIPGVEETTHVVYTLLGESTVMPGSGDEEADIAWVAVVDAVAAKVAGGSADPNGVAGDVVRLVFEDLGLVYDTVAGESFYTWYPGWDFSGASLDMTAFLERSNGERVNCSDCASLVSIYANMVGCDLRYNIIGYDFALNYIRAIGTDDFTNDPFGTGVPGGFSYHAVTSPDDASTIFDATLALDGDGSPESPPHAEQIVDGVDGDFYLDHLSPHSPRYEYDEKTDID